MLCRKSTYLHNALLQMVVANRLDTRKTTVTLVTVDWEEKVQLTQDEVAEGIEIEERIVNAVVAKHKSLG